MQILGLLHQLLTVCSVLRFQKRVLQSLLGGFIFMDFLTCLGHLSQDYDHGYGFFLFGSFKKVSEVLGLFLLLAFGLKSLYYPWISIQFLCDLREKSGKSKTEFSSEKVDDEISSNDIVEESTQKSNSYCGSGTKINREFDEKYDVGNHNDDVKENTEDDGVYDDLYSVDDDELQTEEDGESDVSALRELIKIERRRANAARAELEKERAASATAAEEAMAMILRLQHDKSSIEMEFSQYRRLAEEKQIHDQEVIQSLHWLVWRNETEMSLLQEELKLCRRKLNRPLNGDEGDKLEEEVEECPSCFSGCSEDVLENVLYSSLDYNLSPN